jgi:hypothetical protein
MWGDAALDRAHAGASSSHRFCCDRSSDAAERMAMSTQHAVVLDEIERRLRALASDPPFRFVNTTQLDARAHLTRAETFEGFPEDAIAHMGAELGVTLPLLLRMWMLRMGRASGDLFCGSDLVTPLRASELRTNANVLLHESGRAALPSNAFVFLFHQGYSFYYVLCSAGEDPEVYAYTEGERESKLIAGSFSALLMAELVGLEENHRASKESGGYFLEVRGSGEVRHYPAIASGARPLDEPHRYRPWWKLWG